MPCRDGQQAVARPVGHTQFRAVGEKDGAEGVGVSLLGQLEGGGTREDCADAAKAQAAAEDMAKKLLANMVIESFKVEIAA